MKNAILLIFLISLSLLYADNQPVIIDSLHQISVIKSEEAKKLQIFSDYPGFTQAKLHQDSDAKYYFEIIHSGEQGLEIKKRYVTEAELIEIRKKLMSFHQNSYTDKDNEGRLRIIIGYSYLTIGYYGWAIPVSMNLDGQQTAGMYFLDSGLIIGSLLSMTKKSSVSYADADLSVQTATRGILHGILLTSALNQNIEQEVFGISACVSMLEGAFAYQFSQRNKLTEGQANAITLYHDFAGGQFVGLANSVNAFESNNVSLVNSLALLSLYSGASFGVYAGNKINFTKGDVIAARTTWNMYGLGSLAISQMADLNLTQTSLLYCLFATGGMENGEYLAKKYQLSTSTGNYLALSTVAGGLMGCGFSYMAKMDKHLPLTSAGSVIGYYLYSKNMSSQHASVKENKKFSFNTSINPMALKTNSPILNFQLNF